MTGGPVDVKIGVRSATIPGPRDLQEIVDL